MNATDYLIYTLADGEFHSGVELGDGLGVTRTAVWKTLDKLKELGLEVESVKGKGYRLQEPLDLLRIEDIQGELEEDVAARLQKIDVFTALDSTNQWMLSRTKEASGAICRVCLAEFQTTGRGRRGRNWQSPFAKNLCLSVGYTFSEGFSALEGLSLAVGVMVAQALQPYRLADLQLKWPNDIWVHRKKLGGILIEINGEQSGPCHVVIGLGLNVLMRQSDIEHIDQAWTSLVQESEVPLSRSALAGCVINSLVRGLELFEREGFAAFRDRWLELDGLRGHSVYVAGAANLDGIAQGIGNHGHLLIETAEGVKEVAAGEVSVRCA